MAKSSGGRGTRTDTDHFLIGPEVSNLGKDARQEKLPLLGDVMKYFFHRKNLPDFKYKPVDSVICCPFKSGTLTANCDDNSKCLSHLNVWLGKLRVMGTGSSQVSP